jgi:orotate phosphoribosyltransferase
MNKFTEEIVGSIRRAVALQLWELGAVQVNLKKPFKLTSGNYSPIYVNCRRLISSPGFVDLFTAATRITCEASRVNFDVVAGGETAGIPFAAFVGRAFGKPMIYVRKEAKSHGIASRIEGLLPSSARVLLVEDLITDAGSKLGFIKAIRQSGAAVKDVIVVFDRLQGGQIALKKNGVALHALTDMNMMLAIGKEAGALSSEARNIVNSYLKSPRKWHKAVGMPFIA